MSYPSSLRMPWGNLGKGEAKLKLYNLLPSLKLCSQIPMTELTRSWTLKRKINSRSNLRDSFPIINLFLNFLWCCFDFQLFVVDRFKKKNSEEGNKLQSWTESREGKQAFMAEIKRNLELLANCSMTPLILVETNLGTKVH